MRTNVGRFLAAALLFAAVGFFIMPSAYAQGVWPPPEFKIYDMTGSWVVQVSGPVFLPAPFDSFNGPFVRTGRLLFTPDGKIEIKALGNYNGFVEKESYTGTFSVGADGSVAVLLKNLPLPSLPPGTPNVITFEGFICESGQKVKLMMSKVEIGGQPLPNIGTVIFGELIRQ